MAFCLLAAAAFVLAARLNRTSNLAPERLAPAVTLWNQPDPVLGWSHQPNARQLTYQANLPQGHRFVTVTLWPGGERATGPGGPPAQDHRSELWTIGCSFTFGLDVSDDESYPWQLQQRRPDLRVRNLGVTAYGTAQSLLALRERLAQGARAPADIVYGLADFHDLRNVNDYAWLQHMTDANAAVPRHIVLAIPRGSLDQDGGLRLYGPEPLRRLRCSPASSLCRLIDPLLNLEKFGRARGARRVTEALVRALETLSREHGSRLTVAFLDGSQASLEGWRSFAAATGIRVVDARVQDVPVAAGEHPVPAQYARVAETLAQALPREPAR